MKVFEKILLATDFSQGAAAALDAAIALAQTYQAEIIPLHAIALEEALQEKDRKTMGQHVATALQAIEGKIRSADLPLGQTLTVFGDPSDQIVQLANFQEADLIIMGARGDDEAGTHPIGLTTQKVMRKAQRPVWAAWQGSTVPPKSIVCAVDFSGPSQHALANAIDLAHNLAAELTVLHIVHPLSRFDLGLGRRADEARAEYEREQQFKFSAFLKRFDLSPIRCTQTIRQGKPHQEILALTEELEADLLLMGSEGRSGVARFFMGSVAERVIRQIPCSMITVKSQDAIRPRVEVRMAAIEKGFTEGWELLKEGCPVEAMGKFDHCLSQDMTFVPAWEGMVTANEQLGNQFMANEYKKQVEAVRAQTRKRQNEAQNRRDLWERRQCAKPENPVGQ